MVCFTLVTRYKILVDFTLRGTIFELAPPFEATAPNELYDHLASGTLYNDFTLKLVSPKTSAVSLLK